MSALILLSPTLKNRKGFTSAMMINKDKIVSFYPDPAATTTKTLLYMDYKGKTWEFNVTHTANTVATRCLETTNNSFVWLNVQAIRQGFGWFKPQKHDFKMRINCDRIIWCYNTSTTQSYVFVDRGLDVVCYLTSHLVSEISYSFSRSRSMSAS
jgi:hypothetical protein